MKMVFIVLLLCSWTMITVLSLYKDTVLPKYEIKFWILDGRKIALSLQWDFLY